MEERSLSTLRPIRRIMEARLIPLIGNDDPGPVCGQGSTRCVQGAVPIGQDVKTAQGILAAVEDKIGNDISFMKSRLEKFAREVAPVAGQGKIGGLNGHQVGGKECRSRWSPYH